METIGTYSDMVKDLALRKSDELVSNGLIDHAKVLIGALLSHAESEIRIFSCCLKNEIYNDESVLKGLYTLLSKDQTSIKILLQDPRKLSFSNNEFVNILTQWPERYQLKEVTHKADKGLVEHFVIMDKVGYRYCPDKDQTRAVASFNRPGTASNLAKQFEVLFERAASCELKATNSFSDDFGAIA